tara:strand:+ start:1086 stop:1703 length:618 start_codon:yes stop_codon:yes gene_type:complete
MCKLSITNEDNMDLMGRYEDNHFDLAIIDPPYRNSKDNDMMPQTRKNIKKGRLKDWQNAPNKNFFDELIRVSKNQIIWGANNFEFKFKGFIVWDKNIAFDMKFSMCEIASVSEGLSTISKMVKIRSAGAEKRIHPTQKPVKLYEWILMNYAKKGDKILDTHLGSGSIAIATHNLGYDLTACELDKEYYEAAIKRIEQHKQQIRMF